MYSVVNKTAEIIHISCRQQLEQQRKETERLNTQFLTDGFSTSTSRPSTVLPMAGSPSKTGFSTLPSTELFSSRRPASVTGAIGSMEIGPPYVTLNFKKKNLDIILKKSWQWIPY